MINNTKTMLPHCAEKKPPKWRESFEEPPILTRFLTQLSFTLILLLSFISQWCQRYFFPDKMVKESHRNGYPPLFDRFSMFYSRYVYRRVRDCWNHPICSVPGAQVTLIDRITPDNGWTFHETGDVTQCLNLASYNYLGFSESNGECAQHAIAALWHEGHAVGATRHHYGTTPLHHALEQKMAAFLGVDDCLTFGMGYATNALNLPTLLAGPASLVISDEKNHASLIWGIKLNGGVTVRVFRHNDMTHLEALLQEAVYYGRGPNIEGHYQAWRKIIIIVEGVYSMEGSIVHLSEVIALKKRYHAYLYLDEAHSIGAMGPNGRGIIDYFQTTPATDIDCLMGTFTKSFGSAGGYIAGSHALIAFLRRNSPAFSHAHSMAPPLVAQIIHVIDILSGRVQRGEGQRRICQLARNTRYFRRRLAQIGVIVHGHEDSPVVPILVYFYAKIAAVVRMLRENRIAVVGVGYPATPLYEGRIRICLSAGHTIAQLDHALDVIEHVADVIGLKYSRMRPDLTPIQFNDIKVYDEVEDGGAGLEEI